MHFHQKKTNTAIYIFSTQEFGNRVDFYLESDKYIEGRGLVKDFKVVTDIFNIAYKTSGSFTFTGTNNKLEVFDDNELIIIIVYFLDFSIWFIDPDNKEFKLDII